MNHIRFVWLKEFPDGHLERHQPVEIAAQNGFVPPFIDVADFGIGAFGHGLLHRAGCAGWASSDDAGPDASIMVEAFERRLSYRDGPLEIAA